MRTKGRGKDIEQDAAKDTANHLICRRSSPESSAMAVQTEMASHAQSAEPATSVHSMERDRKHSRWLTRYGSKEEGRRARNV